ncbi:MAG: chromosomal replication initiator protein DnaA [Verrucomicrobia bacterium]|nr:chromosomal replication initiator protein DnaA [Verrucomicrobiota bacterium]MCH8513795.1 chromosomal replication initiator protein DnaA [Kiritimatiellia bacterium]
MTETSTEMDHHELWQQVCGLLRESLSEDIFDRWIAVIQPGNRNGEVLELKVANDFYSTWLEENYVPMIATAFTAVSGDRVQFKLVVDQNMTPMPDDDDAKNRSGQNASESDREDETETGTQAPNRHPSQAGRGQSHPQGHNGKYHGSPGHSGRERFSLNPRYVFETFVVGSSNDFAHAAAMAVAQTPARAYNPLFLYGGVGLGKTHLMQAIGNFATTSNPGCRVCYLSCESFVNEYIDALQNSKLPQFRKRFRSADILLIDDIQFLAGKDRLQEEFFHTFNALFDGHKQIVLTCDRPATEIPGLERRLVSRFEWGLVTEIDAPEFETRMAILRKKAELMDVQVSDSVIRFIAERIAANVRRLEGALVRAASYASLTNRDLSTEAMERILRDCLDDEAPALLTMERIQRAVAEHFDIRYSDILSRKRPANIAMPRQVAMYLCRDMTSHSLPAIGEAFGKNHATVLHACRNITKQEKDDPTLRQSLATIREQLTRPGK